MISVKEPFSLHFARFVQFRIYTTALNYASLVKVSLPVPDKKNCFYALRS